MIKVHCNCGAVAFEIKSDINDIYVCHCSICRRSTGANGISVIVSKLSDFKWTNGSNKIKTWHKPKHDWQTSFCQTCGSTLPGDNDDSSMYIPTGLISEGDENFKIAHHIWVDSKAPWYEICGQGKQHKRAFIKED